MCGFERKRLVVKCFFSLPQRCPDCRQILDADEPFHDCPLTHDRDVAEELGTVGRLTRLQARQQRKKSPKAERMKAPKKSPKVVSLLFSLI